MRNVLPHDIRMVALKEIQSISQGIFNVYIADRSELSSVCGFTGLISAEYGLEIMAQALGVVGSASDSFICGELIGGVVVLIKDYILNSEIEFSSLLFVRVLVTHDEGDLRVGKCSIIDSSNNGIIQSAEITIKRLRK